MAEITAAAVKDLREQSGAGMMDCKKALTETGGDMEAAIDWLRAKGLAAAAKKSSRTAAEGLVGVAVAGTKGAAVEVNSRDRFRRQERPVPGLRPRRRRDRARDGRRHRRAQGRAYPGGGTVDEVLTDNIATIGENQSLRRAKRRSKSTQGAVVPYIHNAAAPGLGKIGVLVALESDAGADVLEPLGKQIAMHIAAAFPLALNDDGLDPDDDRARARDRRAKRPPRSASPPRSSPRWSKARSPSSRKENALLSQLFVMDGKTPIADVVAKAGKDAGTTIALKDYVRFQLGEGIEKEESDFAAEVAAAAGV